KVVGEHLDQVLTAVVGRPGPRAIAVREGEPGNALVAVRNVVDADLILPVDAADHGGLRRIVVLLPVVAAAIEVVKHGRRKSEVPGAAEHVGVALQIVIVYEQAGKPRGSIGSRFLAGAVISPVSR